MKIGVIGAGRLGICFALLCEAAGYDVLVSDIREEYVNDLNQRKIVTTEPEVENTLAMPTLRFRANWSRDHCKIRAVIAMPPNRLVCRCSYARRVLVFAEFRDYL